MAFRIEKTGSSTTSLTLRLAGLGNPGTSSYYSNLQINGIHRWGSSSWYVSGDGYYCGEVTFSGLSPNTLYTFNGGATPNGSYERPVSAQYRTDAEQTYPPDAPSISLNSVTGKTIKINVYTGANTSQVEFDYYWLTPTVDATMSAGSYGSYTHQFTVPDYNTTYTIDCRGKNGTLVSGWSNQVSFTSGSAPIPSTPTVAPGLTASSGTNGRGNGGFYVTINEITNATSYDVRAQIGSTTYSEVNTTSLSGIWLGGLSYGTSYSLSYRAINNSGASSYSPTSSATTLPQNVSLSGDPLGTSSIRIYRPSITGGWTDIEVERWSSTGATYYDTKTFSGSYVDWTGLSSNTTYKFKARARLYVNSTWLYSYSYSPWLDVKTATPAPATPEFGPSLTSSMGIDGRGNGGVWVTISQVTNANNYDVRARVGSTVYSQVEYTTSLSGIWLGGMPYGTSHVLEYRARNDVGVSGWSPYTGITTLPENTALEGTPVGASTIRIQRVGTPSGGWTDIEVERWTSTGGTYIDSKTFSGTYVDWTGLTANTAYKFKARTRYYVNSTWLYSYSYSPWTDVKTGARPVDWGWTTGTDGNGNKRSGTNFTMLAAEWNEFCNRINDFRGYKGMALNPITDTYTGVNSFHRAVSGQLFTANQFNQAVDAIHDVAGNSGVSMKSVGNTIYASDLNALKNKLNSVT